VELIVVPWDQVLDVLQESHRKGAGSAIVISAGFAERASTTAPYWVAPCR
jgi:acyl-CoA synthetase (NDP forming)